MTSVKNLFLNEATFWVIQSYSLDIGISRENSWFYKRNVGPDLNGRMSKSWCKNCMWEILLPPSLCNLRQHTIKHLMMRLNDSLYYSLHMSVQNAIKHIIWGWSNFYVSYFYSIQEAPIAAGFGWDMLNLSADSFPRQWKAVLQKPLLSHKTSSKLLFMIKFFLFFLYCIMPGSA